MADLKKAAPKSQGPPKHDTNKGGSSAINGLAVGAVKPANLSDYLSPSTYGRISRGKDKDKGKDIPETNADTTTITKPHNINGGGLEQHQHKPTENLSANNSTFEPATIFRHNSNSMDPKGSGSMSQRELETISERQMKSLHASKFLVQRMSLEMNRSSMDLPPVKTTELHFETEPTVDKVKFNWKIKNLSNLCIPGRFFMPIRSPEFTAGGKVGKPDSWCFELRCNSGYLSLVLCHDKIRMKAKQLKDELASNIPCHMTMFSADGSIAFEGDASPYPMKVYAQESSYGKIQELAKKFHLSALSRETVGWKKFISITEVHEKRDIYLGDEDTLEFSMELDISGVVPIPTPDEVCSAQLIAVVNKYQDQARLMMVRDIGHNLWKTGDGANLIIQCGSTNFSVHKQILHARCPKFSNALNSVVQVHNNSSKLKTLRTPEPPVAAVKTVKTTDGDPEILKAFLEFIYTAQVTTLSDYVKWECLLLLSLKYNLVDLKKLCFLKCLELMTVDNIGGFILLAENHGASEEVKELVKGFCTMNMEKIKMNEEFSKIWRHHSSSFRFMESIHGF